MQMGQITRNAHQESAAANSVNSTLLQMATSTRESVEGAQQVVSASNQLQVTASTLDKLVHQFDLREIAQEEYE